VTSQSPMVSAQDFNDNPNVGMESAGLMLGGQMAKVVRETRRVLLSSVPLEKSNGTSHLGVGPLGVVLRGHKSSFTNKVKYGIDARRTP
jgi:hypothetical protein